MKKKVLLIACLSILCFCAVGCKSDSDTDSSKKSSSNQEAKQDKKIEKKLREELEEMGADFYENYYYKTTGDNDEERKKFVKKYHEMGIKIDLDNLSKSDSDIVEENKDEFKKYDCDKTDTKVIIYPQEPFGKNDYKIETELKCSIKSSNNQETIPSKEEKVKEETKQDKKIEKYLREDLEEMGIDFYENFYYEAINGNDESGKKFLQKYSEIGIKIGLDSFSEYNSDVVQGKINDFTKYDCDKTNTIAIIYPKEPFGRKDYKIETRLDCSIDE